MRITVSALAAALVLSALVSPSQAAFEVYGKDSNGNRIDNIVVNPGEKVPIGLYLKETDDNPVLAGMGVGGASIRLGITTVSGDPFRVESTTDVQGAAFDVSNPVLSQDGGAVINQTNIFGQPLQATQLSPTMYEVFLGRFTVTAPTTMGSIATITLGDKDPGVIGDIVLGANPNTLNVDDNPSVVFARGNARIATTAIPEPGSFAMLSVAGVIALGAYRIRRRRQQG